MKKTTVCIISAFIIVFCTALPAFAQSPIEITAQSGILVDADSMTVLFEKNANKKCYPASVTKIMSLLLVAEAIDSGKISKTDKVTASADAAAKGGSQIWLKEGETMTVDELLKACAIASANDACCALGEYIAGSEQSFVKMMNERAESLGMKNTHFENCSGLDDETKDHLTTAYDIAAMSAELLKHEIITEYSTTWMDSLRNGETQLVNTNKLVRFYEGTTGLKTGTTSKAGCCISASAKRNGMHLIAVVMGAPSSNDRFDDAKKMLNYGFAEYEKAAVQIKDEDLSEIRVKNGQQRYVDITVGEMHGTVIKKGKNEKITYSINLPESVEAPVEKGEKIGEAIFMLDGKVLTKADVKTASTVGKKTFFYVLKCFFTSYNGIA